jgi:DNA repair protein RecN (Recombination protein N)
MLPLCPLLQISRMPAAAGALATRSRVLINGAASSLRVLRALGALLADVNGQHASLALRDSATQLQLLDRIAGRQHSSRGDCWVHAWHHARYVTQSSRVLVGL